LIFLDTALIFIYAFTKHERRSYFPKICPETHGNIYKVIELTMEEKRKKRKNKRKKTEKYNT